MSRFWPYVEIGRRPSGTREPSTSWEVAGSGGDGVGIHHEEVDAVGSMSKLESHAVIVALGAAQSCQSVRWKPKSGVSFAKNARWPSPSSTG